MLILVELGLYNIRMAKCTSTKSDICTEHPVYMYYWNNNKLMTILTLGVNAPH